MKRILAVFILLLLFLPFQSLTAVDAMKHSVMITAHRGSSGAAPENTISAVLLAAQQGAGYAEVDVQMTADGVVVLYHDRTMSKLGISRKVSELHYSDVIHVDAGGWFSPEYVGEKIPTLEQVMIAAHRRIKLNIELKMYEPNMPLPEAVAQMIEQHQFIDQCIVTSFDAEAIRRIKAANPYIKTGLIVSSKKKLTDEVWSSGEYDLLSLKSKLVDRSIARKAATFGKELHVWTVNKEKEMKRLLKHNVSSIITDYPERLHEVMKFY